MKKYEHVIFMGRYDTAKNIEIDTDHLYDVTVADIADYVISEFLYPFGADALEWTIWVVGGEITADVKTAVITAVRDEDLKRAAAERAETEAKELAELKRLREKYENA